MKTFFFKYTSPEYLFAQYEGAGFSLRIGNRAWTFGRLDYRDRPAPWPMWARVRIVLGHKSHQHEPREWSVMVLGRKYQIGQKPIKLRA
jgi:hypothetical protein